MESGRTGKRNFTEAFYENLTKGLEKDEALRQAKLDCLENRSGRMLAPQYWAGLVIMGDTAAIDLQQKSNIWLMLIFGILLVLLGAFYKRYT